LPGRDTFIDSTLNNAGLAFFGVADLAGFMDLLAGKADI
jgi:hypothetical protein